MLNRDDSCDESAKAQPKVVFNIDTTDWTKFYGPYGNTEWPYLLEEMLDEHDAEEGTA